MVIALGGIPDKVQIGDWGLGVDGRIFRVGTKPSDSASMFSDNWFHIQVKQMDKVGRLAKIDAFEAVMEREGEGGRQRGFFVSFGYTNDAELGVLQANA